MGKKKVSRKELISKLMRIIKRYGKVRVIVQDSDYDKPCGCLCKSCLANFEQPDQRRRVIDDKGNCMVAYRGSGYDRWSGYEESCFMGNYETHCHWCASDTCSCIVREKKTVKKTLELMFNHDNESLEPILIEYGFRFKKKVKL